eukprot:121125_1
MLFKQVAMGVIMHKGSYLRSSWNVLDFVIVVISWLNLIALDNIKFIKAFRVLRALRPLRMISHFAELRVVVNSVFATFPGLARVGVVALMFLFVFGIIGVYEFGGKLYR